MFSKIWVSCVLVSVLCLQVTAHAIVSPALGINGTPVRADAQQPSTQSPCGKLVTNITSAIDSAMAVPVDKNGSFQVKAQNFNGGVDGSLMFKARVDANGTGANFISMLITTNGDNAPAGVENQTLVASLPSGTKCTGGKTGNLCLVQFISGGKFGNCVVVSQATADGSSPTPTGVTDTANAMAAGNCSAANHHHHHPASNSTASAAPAVTPRAGSLMARLLLTELKAQGISK